MMFRSGNFLTAFALSVVPALICIALIVAGQHTCENVPWKLDNFQNPLNLGLALIWSGNAWCWCWRRCCGGDCSDSEETVESES